MFVKIASLSRRLFLNWFVVVLAGLGRSTISYAAISNLDCYEVGSYLLWFPQTSVHTGHSPPIHSVVFSEPFVKLHKILVSYFSLGVIMRIITILSYLFLILTNFDRK